jgi:hypothetical protein
VKIYNKKSLIVTFFLWCVPTIVCASVGGVIKRSPTIIIKTIAEASASIGKIINDFPQNAVVLPTYEKSQSDLIVKCAKILYDAARMQILQALSEIDNRIAYWQYQKDHPWNYFVSKNPMKWVTGPKQEDEIESNLDTLKSHQGELYVLLGQLAECGMTFTRGYKDEFLTDYTKGYEWVDTLLDTLVRIVVKYQRTSDVPFLARLYQLQSKLDRVSQFKNDLLSDITETEIPSYVARNWFKGGLALMGLNYGYKNITAEHLNSSLAIAQQGFSTIADPLTSTLKDVLTPGWRKNVGQLSGELNKILPSLPESYSTKLEVVKNFVTEMGNKYNLQEEAHNVLNALNNKDSSAYEKFLEDITKASANVGWSPLAKGRSWLVQNWEDYLRGQVLWGKLEGAQLAIDSEKWALEQKKQYEQQYSAVGKVVLLIPAVLAAGTAYMAYQKLTEKNYGPLRRALVDINSLLVDPSKPLNDERYGKMLYLIYMLKNRAMKELPIKKNTRADFIADLERIESPEYNVASKRAIIEDMFKKYSFLGLIQKK